MRASTRSLAVVRLASLDEDALPAWLALERVAQARPWSETQLREELTLGTVIGAYQRRTLVGAVAVREMAGERAVMTLAVHPDFRRAGTATTLMRRVLREARAAGEPVWLEVRADNGAARALYERLGFKPQGVRPGYYDDGDGARHDALTMRWP